MFRTQNGRLGDFQGPVVTASGASGVGACPVDMRGEDAHLGKKLQGCTEDDTQQTSVCWKPHKVLQFLIDGFIYLFIEACMYVFIYLFLCLSVIAYVFHHFMQSMNSCRYMTAIKMWSTGMLFFMLHGINESLSKLNIDICFRSFTPMNSSALNSISTVLSRLKPEKKDITCNHILVCWHSKKQNFTTLQIYKCIHLSHKYFDANTWSFR